MNSDYKLEEAIVYSNYTLMYKTCANSTSIKNNYVTVKLNISNEEEVIKQKIANMYKRILDNE